MINILLVFCVLAVFRAWQKEIKKFLIDRKFNSSSTCESWYEKNCVVINPTVSIFSILGVSYAEFPINAILMVAIAAHSLAQASRVTKRRSDKVVISNRSIV